jgi:3'-phosphoadenosine 5'-phosphosulfate sulfotransferase (PAPS reductase)/FAD synthetase
MSELTIADLDMPTVEAAAMTLDEAMAHSRLIVDVVRRTHNPVALIGLFSGGNDSTTFMHLLRSEMDHAAHVNTGIGIPATAEYVRSTCAAWGLDLIELSPEGPNRYRDLALKYGFPGPAGHSLMFRHLKERQFRRLRKMFVTDGRKQRVMFLAGMRFAESSRRMRNTEVTHRDGSVVWCSPIAYWTGEHMAEYRRRFDVPRNPVADALHMSGECLCGAFAKPGELDEIAFWYPEVAVQIRSLEREVTEAHIRRGEPLTACRWGQRPTAAEVPGQLSMIERADAMEIVCGRCEAGIPDDVIDDVWGVEA